MSDMKLPWTVHVEEGVRRFCERTGEPVQPLNYYWIRDTAGCPIHLVSGRTEADRHLAELFAAAPEMIEALREIEQGVSTLDAARLAAKALAKLERKRP